MASLFLGSARYNLHRPTLLTLEKEKTGTQVNENKGQIWKKLGSNEEVIAAAEAYWEAKDKSSYQHGSEMLEKLWNHCLPLDDFYVNE